MMDELLYDLLFLLIGFWVGRYWLSHWYFIKSALLKYKIGICFKYEGKGYNETIDGTYSEFCRKCGHPAGYHF